MSISEEELRSIVRNFMVKVKPETVSAMVEVICQNSSVLSAANKYGLTHQSLAKNINRFENIQFKLNTLNNHDLMDAIWKSSTIRKVYFQAMKQGFWEDFPDEGLSAVADMLKIVGLRNSKELIMYIDSKSDVMSDFLECLHKTHKIKKGLNWRISFCFVVQLMLIVGFKDKLTLDYLLSHGWERDIVELVFDASDKVNGQVV
ncbi:hypothetical protein ACS6BV_004711 [Vibrio alginolyticus]|nr:hypothetical protein [Vibrio alginolyticus]